MKDYDYRYIKTATQVVLGCVSTVCPAISAVAPVADLAIDAFQDKNNACIGVSDSDIRKKCKLKLKENTGSYSDDELEMLTATVSICLDNIKTLSQVYDDNIAYTLSEAFLNKRKADFGNREYAFLKNNLSEILRRVIHEIERNVESNPEYQVSWKHYVASYCQTVDSLSERVDNHDKWLANHDRRIIELEKRPNIHAHPITNISETCQSRWNDTMFLDRDREIALSSVYQLPHYEDEIEPLFDVLQSTLDLCNNINNRALLILGHPGSGKSTLITYILNKCQIQQDRRVKVFRFSGFEGIDWNGNVENLPQQMLSCMMLDNKSELSDSVLILDGLDEIDMRLDQEELIEELFKQWVRSKQIIRFSLLITCRTNRIDEPARLPVRTVILSPLQEDQIMEFVVAYLSQKDNDEKRMKDWLELVQNKESIGEVIGIPLFLYLALALDVQIDKNCSLENIYSQIFTLDGKNSIYYRSAYDKKHPITSVEAKAIHLFSKKFAEKIWDACPNEATVSKELYLPIVTQIVGDEQSELKKILVGQYFIEGNEGNDLLFAHRSMYEYFVAVSIYDDFLKAFETHIDPAQMLKDLNVELVDLSCILGLQNLSSYPEIQSYLKSMMERTPIGNAYWWRSFFTGFIEYGLSELAVDRRKGGQVGLEEELNRFYNLIWMVREQLSILGDKPPIEIQKGFSETKLLFIPYEGIIDLHGLDLSGITLLGRNLSGASFYGSNLRKVVFSYSDLTLADFSYAHMNDALLSETTLIEANFDRADLSNADLRNAILSDGSFQNAILIEANLSGADLSNADLRFADFTGANLQGANLTGAIIEGTIFVQTDLSGATLSNLDFSGLSCRKALFVDAIMNNIKAKNTDFREAVLTRAIMSNAEISDSIFSFSRLDETDLREAYLYHCKFIHTRMQNADLSSATLNESTIKKSELVYARADNASFQAVKMEKTDMSNMTLVYADFSGAQLNDVTVTAGILSSIIFDPSERSQWTLNENVEEMISFDEDTIGDTMLLERFEEDYDPDLAKTIEWYRENYEENTNSDW